MRTYVYCSYKFSPVGFQMGTIEYDAAQKNFYIPSKGKLNNFVVKAFEQNFIAKMYGLLPEGGKYIFLVKNLKQSGVNDPNEGTINFYMNFAFEFDNFSDYNNFCGNFNALIEDGDAAAECAKFIVTDRNVETFALKIDAEKFNSFIAKMLRTNDGGQVNKNFFVEVNSAQIEESKLLETFGLEFSKDTDKKFCYPAKKNFPINTRDGRGSCNSRGNSNLFSDAVNKKFSACDGRFFCAKIFLSLSLPRDIIAPLIRLKIFSAVIR